MQQVAQERFGETPFYDSEGARVGNHREYTSVVFAGAEPLGTGHGPTKQEAEQEAARVALEKLTGTSAAKAVAAKPAKSPRTRTPRAPRTPRVAPGPPAEENGAAALPPAEAGLVAPEPSAEVTSEAVAESPDPPPPTPRRSRQFGEPLE